MDGRISDSADTQLLDNFPSCHGFIVCEPYYVNPAGQVGDVKLLFGFGDLAGDDILSIQVHYG
jgi:hypothetical protein